MRVMAGTDLILLGLQPPEAALAVDRDAELADVGEQLHGHQGRGGSLVTVLSVCCQWGGNVVKTLITR